MKTFMFASLAKIDEAKREVWGVATEERPDRSDEIFDYASSAPYFKKWSDDISKATNGKSLGNIRQMHQLDAVGKVISISFDDANKRISIGTKIVDDNAWKKVAEGVFTGFSIGGRYVKTWEDGDYIRFTATPSEISVVDLPCVPGATFQAIKADGSIELRKFATSHKSEPVAEVEKSAEAAIATEEIAVDIAQPAAEAVATEELTHAEPVEKTEAVAADTSAETAANTTQGEPIQRMAEELNLAAEALSKAEKESVQGHLKNAIEAHAAVGEFLKQCMVTLGADPDGDADKAATAEVEKAEEAVAVVAEPVVETVAEPVAVEAVIEKAAPVVAEPNAEVLAKMNEIASQFSAAQETIAKLTERLAVLESKPVADNVAVSGTLVARTAKSETSVFNKAKDITDTGL